MPAKTITAEMLEDLGACANQVREFKNRFPDGATCKTEAEAVEICLSVASVFDWGWAANKLLTAQAWKAYKAVRPPAWESYKVARSPARESYEADRAKAFAIAFMKE